MDSLDDILRNKDFREPRESKAIKNFVKKRFDEVVSVELKQNSIIIVSSSSALADSLRQLGPHIQEAARTDKKLVFRIS
jgi:hypothetical protein